MFLKVQRYSNKFSFQNQPQRSFCNDYHTEIHPGAKFGRSMATVGGSIWGRFGFSDVLTVFLAMDSYVELYKGGIVQGIGHTLFENVTYDKFGKPIESSFMQYKVPTRLDMGRLTVEFEHSYEPTGPFGAKSIGEIVINTPGPAIAHAIYRATGVWHRELPITPEMIAMSSAE